MLRFTFDASQDNAVPIWSSKGQVNGHQCGVLHSQSKSQPKRRYTEKNKPANLSAAIQYALPCIFAILIAKAVKKILVVEDDPAV
jgi:PleD family two-component response regulator